MNDCYSAIYAIEKFKIVVYDCSHVLCSKHNGNIIPFHKCQKHLLTVQKNCVLIFRGGHIHGGAAFGHNEGKCHRLFLYLVPDGVQHELKTYKNVQGCSGCAVCTRVEGDGCIKHLLKGEGGKYPSIYYIPCHVLIPPFFKHICIFMKIMVN